MSALRTLWSLRHRRPWFVAGSIGAMAFLLAYPVFHWWLQSVGVAGGFRYFDLGAYRIAVDNWQAGDPIYVEADDGGYHGSYLYPPVYVLLFWPLAGLGFEAAGHVWNAVSVGLLWLGLQAAIAAYGLRLAWYERILLLWGLLGFHPVILSMRLAQVSVFLAGVLSIALAGVLYAGDGDRRAPSIVQYASGAATAVGGTVKLVYAPAGAHLLQHRRRFAGAVVTGFVLLVISIVVFGVDTHREYLDVLAWGKGWGDSRHPQVWGPAYYRPLYAVSEPIGLAVRIAVAAAVTTLAVLAADEGADAETFALGVAAIPLVAPQVYTQDLAVFLPVVVVLLATELDRENGHPIVPVVGLWLAAVHAYGLYAIVNVLPDRLPRGEFLIDLAPVLQPGLWAALLLAGLAAWRVAESAALPARWRTLTSAH